jgi:hypothetical protein
LIACLSCFPAQHPEKLCGLAVEAGFEVLGCGYVQKETVNHKENIHAPRIFIQAKLRKP